MHARAVAPAGDVKNNQDEARVYIDPDSAAEPQWRRTFSSEGETDVCGAHSDGDTANYEVMVPVEVLMAHTSPTVTIRVAVSPTSAQRYVLVLDIVRCQHYLLSIV